MYNNIKSNIRFTNTKLLLKKKTDDAADANAADEKLPPKVDNKSNSNLKCALDCMNKPKKTCKSKY